jgi:hypothetical protein
MKTKYTVTKLVVANSSEIKAPGIKLDGYGAATEKLSAFSEK